MKVTLILRNQRRSDERVEEVFLGRIVILGTSIIVSNPYALTCLVGLANVNLVFVLLSQAV